MLRLVFLALLLAQLCAAKIERFDLVSVADSSSRVELLADTTITLSPQKTIEAVVFGPPSTSVTFTAPFPKVERAAPFSLTGDFPQGDLAPLKLAPGRYRVTASDSNDPFKQRSVPFRVFAKPMVAPLVFPPTLAGSMAVLHAGANLKETTGKVTYQWEITTTAGIVPGNSPIAIKGATGKTLELKDVKCEDYFCLDRGGGCSGFLRYTVQVCDAIGCVRSNPVAPNVVRAKGGNSICRKFFQVFAPDLEKLPEKPVLRYPATPLGGKAVLTAYSGAILERLRATEDVAAYKYQWEVTKIAFGLAEESPKPIKGATGPTLTIENAACEKAVCTGRAGCGGILRYTLKVCNFRGCVRSNAVTPNVVAGNGPAAQKKFEMEKCSPLDVELEPVGEPRRNSDVFFR